MEDGFKMKEKYIRFYKNFHKAFEGKSNHYSNLISDGGVSLNRELYLRAQPN